MSLPILKTDIVIVGGGIVGAALACALGEAECRVVLLDSQAPVSTESTTHDLRVSSITYGCKLWLEKLGVWKKLSAKTISPFYTMSVWEQEGKEKADIFFAAADLGTPALGYIIPNAVLSKALFERLAELPTVNIIRPVKPEALEFHSHSVLVRLSDKNIEAKLIVGADGAFSWVRSQCGFEFKEKPYDHMALMAKIEHELPHDACAMQRFSGNDILAFLPLPNKKNSMLVWSGVPNVIRALKEMSAEEFDQQLQKIWGERLGALHIKSDKFAISLIERHTQKYVKDRVALIGDAAHTLHPLAGQGLNLGLWDAQSLAETILDTKKRKRDYGRQENLRPFERSRYWHNDIMLKIMEASKGLFAEENPLIKKIRKIGMRTLNHMHFLKKKIMKHAAFS